MFVWARFHCLNPAVTLMGFPRPAYPSTRCTESPRKLGLSNSVKISTSTLSIAGGALLLLLAATLVVRKSVTGQPADAGRAASMGVGPGADAKASSRPQDKASRRWDGKRHDDPEV